MGNNGSALPPQNTSSPSNPKVSTTGVHKSDGVLLSKSCHEGTPDKDENHNQPKSNPLPVGRPQISTLIHDVAVGTKRPQSHEAADISRKDDKTSLSTSKDSMPQETKPSPSTMTPVTLPAPSPEPTASSSVTTGVTYAPYVGSYQSSLAMPPFPSYLSVAPPLARYQPVESYSAMLANIGSQFQLAQEQGHLMHQSYLPGGYITLAGPHVSVPPVLIPAASQEIPRDSSGTPGTKTSGHSHSGGQSSHPSAYRTHELLHSKVEHQPHVIGNRLPVIRNVYQDSHTVKVDGTYIPTTAPSTTELTLQRRSSDSVRSSGPSRVGNQPIIPSLDSVLGKTTYPQHASGPGGIKVELPPPTIGIHIGARPSNLVHHNMAIVPPLSAIAPPKSTVYLESGESSKVVPSSLSAPMTCIGETFGSKHKASSARHSAMHSRTETSSSSSSLSSSLSHDGSFVESNIQKPYSFAIGKPTDGQTDRYTERSNNSTGSKTWPVNPSGRNNQEVYQSKEEHMSLEHRQTISSDELARHSQLPSPKDKQNVQSSRPILTEKAPPPMANVPSYFTRGSIIQLANGHLKRVEELQTEDFFSSAQFTDGLKMDSSTVSRIEEDLERNVANISFLVGEHKAQVTVEARLDHPFFVYGRGWSSVNPEVSHKCYDLNCHALAVGDVCVSLTVMEKVPSPNSRRPPSSEGGSISPHHQQLTVNSPERKRQRFQNTRTMRFEESMEDSKPLPKAEVSKSATVKSLSLDNQRSVSFQSVTTTTQSEGVITDQNRNVITSQPSLVETRASVSKETSNERWNQPPKRRWSDPIKCPQVATAQSKEILPHPPHPASLARLAEEN